MESEPVLDLDCLHFQHNSTFNFNDSANLSPDCKNSTLLDDFDTLEDFQSPWFIVYGLGITIIAILGIFGNCLSAVVLSRPQMRSSVSCLLLGLAFCDTLLISISILIFGLPAISDYTGTMLFYRLHFYPLWVPYLFPISITAQTGSVYLTLLVTIERYVAVCYSLHARSLCTWSRARACVLIVLLLACAYNAPRWFEVCTEETLFRFDDNSTVYENAMCPLRSSWAYKTYYINWSYLIVMYLIPFLGLVVLNWAIYQQVRRANLARQALSKLQRREMGLATMLLFVVCVFLLCNVLPLVNNILESFYDLTIDSLVQISNFLVIFNSSVNFVIYCTCGERFRRRLVRMWKEWYCWIHGSCGYAQQEPEYRQGKPVGAPRQRWTLRPDPAGRHGGANGTVRLSGDNLRRETIVSLQGHEHIPLTLRYSDSGSTLTPSPTRMVTTRLSTGTGNGTGIRAESDDEDSHSPAFI